MGEGGRTRRSGSDEALNGGHGICIDHCSIIMGFVSPSRSGEDVLRPRDLTVRERHIDRHRLASICRPNATDLPFPVVSSENPASLFPLSWLFS